jgi:hypothetical protein
MEIYHSRRDCTDENNRILLCELEGEVVRIMVLAMVVKKGTPF